MSPWLSGMQVGPYVLLAPVGEGGMGEVWKARDSRLNRVVAIKRLKGEHIERFAQEARAIATLNHPHICQVHDVGPDYLVLEFVEGRQLPCPLALEEAVRVAIEIATAIEAAHKKGLIHRDLLYCLFAGEAALPQDAFDACSAVVFGVHVLDLPPVL